MWANSEYFQNHYIFEETDSTKELPDNPSIENLEDIIKSDEYDFKEKMVVLNRYISKNANLNTGFTKAIQYTIDGTKIHIAGDSWIENWYIAITKGEAKKGKNSTKYLIEYSKENPESLVLKIIEYTKKDWKLESKIIETIDVQKNENEKINEMLIPVINRFRSIEKQKTDKIKVLWEKYALKSKTHEETSNKTDHLANEMLA